MTITKTFLCQHCSKTFTRKSWYDKHNCANKEKFNQDLEIDLLQALSLFNHWQRRTGFIKRKPKDLDAFRKSPYRDTFISLYKFTRDNQIVSALNYVDWLVDNSVKEAGWKHGDTLCAYQEFVLKQHDYRRQAQITLDEIRKWAEATKQPANRFFELVTGIDVLKMVRSGQLSPWVLFSYEGGLTLVNRLDQEYLHALNEYLNIRSWFERIKDNPDVSVTVEAILDEGLK